MQRFICIHGHFYQPPRENPWLEAIELQDSAYPYHDWNERVTAECYAPNAASRILDGEGRILRVVNNYSQISFNFGPTLLAWMKWATPLVYEAIVESDRVSATRYSGHGSALAQGYNHMIMPLATTRDKRTQVLWGIRDFVHRFGRLPEGMWLPETAVDTETLEMLAEAGILFTILSPYQAKCVRSNDNDPWRDVSNARVDPSTPYRVNLPSGRSISVFFYDGPISRAIAFEDLLTHGEHLAHRMASAFAGHREWPQLVHIATDGETYGHHRPLGDMGLAYALCRVEADGLAKLTNYGEYLAKFPPTQQAQVFDNSSWSCIHGVERWRSNCGCNTGMNGGWTQAWRAPLREALDWLRDQLCVLYEALAKDVLADPWTARDHYIDVILDRSPENVQRFFDEHERGKLSHEDQVRALQLLEMQRHAMLMYTSCGWFFDELSGIETVQVILFAARALQLAQKLTSGKQGVLSGIALEDGFLARLELAPSNIPAAKNGRVMYDRFVRPATVDLDQVTAHYAISSLFENYGEVTEIYGHDVRREEGTILQTGKIRLALGRARITSRITRETKLQSYAVVHLGDQNVYGGIHAAEDLAQFRRISRDLSDVLHRGDVPELIRTIDKHFAGCTYTLRHLFRDQQRKIVGSIIEDALKQASDAYRLVYTQFSTLARFVSDMDVPLPDRVRSAVNYTLNEDLISALVGPEPDLSRVEDILEQMKHAEVEPDRVTAEFRFRRAIEDAAEALVADPDSIELLERFAKMTEISAALPFPMNLWQAQNRYFRVIQSRFDHYRGLAQNGDEHARQWVDAAQTVAERLQVSLPAAQDLATFV